MAILKQTDTGTPVPELCSEHGMSSASFYKWRAKYGGMDTSMMARRAVEHFKVSIRLACAAFGISQGGYHYQAKHAEENDVIADWLLPRPSAQTSRAFRLEGPKYGAAGRIRNHDPLVRRSCGMAQAASSVAARNSIRSLTC